MQKHVLSLGTMLDDRYRIESVLGEGGFGITYSAMNTRIGLKVAVKELFWRGHSSRDAAASSEVALYAEDDAPAFNEQKDRFLREARVIRDFSGENGIAHILDYFEANKTAYIVMEYVEGETLREKLRKNGKMPAEDLLKRFLPLIGSLDRIHGSGVIHRDISPDNIMVQPDGSLKLIDFGAAKAYAADADKMHTTIAKECFAPTEQYDKYGVQGPWTDVYSLCATLYNCVTGTAPESAVQRMFLDELKSPSVLGIDIDPKYELILMRGLQIQASKRWKSMLELGDAIRAALPQEKPPKPKTALWIAVAAGILCTGIAIGLLFFRSAEPTGKFGGITTETFYLEAPEKLTVREFSDCQNDIEAILDEFVGADNYTVTARGMRFDIELPLDCFHDEDIGDVLNDHFKAFQDETNFGLIYQIQPVWEDPETSIIAGKNQIRAADFDVITAIFSYEGYEVPTKGQRANLFVDMKTRLDALNTPYAFGTVYGNDNQIVFRVDPKKISRFVTDTIGETYALRIADECSLKYNSINKSSFTNFFVQEYENGTFGVCYRDSSPDSLKELTEYILNHGQDTLYLQSSNGIAIAEEKIEQPIENGEIEFRNFRIDGMETIDAEHRYIVDYLSSLVNDTDYPISLQKTGEGIWDSEDDGDLLFDVPVDDYIGWKVRDKDNEAEFREVLKRIREETGYTVGMNEKVYYILLNLPLDSQLIDNTNAILPKLIEDYRLNAYNLEKMILILLIDEQRNECFRICLNTGYDFSKDEIYHYADYAILDQGRFDPYMEDFYQWWETFPFEDYGFEKHHRF